MISALLTIIILPLFFREIAVCITYFYRRIIKKKPPIVDGEISYPVANAIWLFWLIMTILSATGLLR